MGTLQDYSILITGGGTGIGLAVTERFIDEGAHVTVMQRGQSGIDNLLERFGSKVEVIKGDVTIYDDNEKAVAAAVDRFGKLDVFVGNAGLYDFNATLTDTDPENLASIYHQVFDVNLLGYLFGAKASVEALRQSKGSIILTASSSSFYAGGGGPIYVASKHAVKGLVRQLAFELAPEIRVNAVAPGGTLTDLSGVADNQGNKQRLSDLSGFGDMVARSVPLGFVSNPEDHAALYTLLASKEQSRFMTAAILQSDGGLEVKGGGRRKRADATKTI